MTQGKYTLVDDKNFKRLNQYKWYAYKHRNTWYARRNSWIKEEKRQKSITMHQMIMGVKEGKQIDHIDGCGLRNLESNLRHVTLRENQQNRHKRSKSKYIGVSKARNRWKAEIRSGYEKRYLGTFDTEKEAHEKGYLDALKQLNSGIPLKDIKRPYVKNEVKK